MCVTGVELKIRTLSPASLDFSCGTTDIRIDSACVLKGPPECVETALREAKTAPRPAGGCAILRGARGGVVLHTRLEAVQVMGGGWILGTLTAKLI